MRDSKHKLAVLSLSLSLVLAAPSLSAGGAVNTSHFGDLGTISAAPRRAVTNAAGATGRWSSGAEAFARRFAGQRGGAGSETFRTRLILEDDLGQVHVRLSQTIAGLPVFGAELITHIDKKSGRIIGVNGNYVVDRDLPSQPQVAANDAISRALAHYGIADANIDTPVLAYVVIENDEVHLVWKTGVRYASEKGDEYDLVFADAITGEAVSHQPQVAYARYREVYDCAGGCKGTLLPSLPGNFMFSEGGSSADPIAMAAYNNTAVAYDYFKYRHGRDAWSGFGGTMKLSVHYWTNYGNAAFNPDALTIWFGDGDGSTYSALAYSQDVVAHEYTHGITHYTAQIPVSFEPGAVNESTSDIFAAATQAYTAGSITSATWKIAEDVYTPGIAGDALRHLNDPAINPGHQDFYPARDLNAETQNAGPMNLAFYLLVTGGQHPRGDTTIFVPGIGMSAAEKIFYRGLHYYANSKTNYRLMREHTLKAAADLYGANSTQQNAVRDAWSAVGNDWNTATAVLSLGQSFAYPSYTTTTTGVHTGHLEGPAGTNFNLHFERWDGTAWVLVTRQLGATSTESIQSPRAAGTYRWRITCAEGSGTSTLHTNTPK